MRDIIPIEIEDAEKCLKEKIRTIEYYSYYHGTREEDVFYKAYLDIDGKTIKRREITCEEFMNIPSRNIKLTKGILL
tara:strand:+ start:220 stop:450 length:231 start_codon:yes stop_codon:yes gene_type:complete